MNAAELSLWYIYIIEAENGFFYTGITKSLEQRFHKHKTGSGGAKFFKTSPPKKIIFFEIASSRSEALKKEAFIKKLTKKKKIEYIQKSYDHTPR